MITSINDFTITNSGIFVILTVVQPTIYFYKVCHSGTIDNTYYHFISSSALINMNLALTFIFMCHLLLSFLKKTILNFLSKLLIYKNGKIRIWGWRSIRFENTIGLHIFSAIWAILWSTVHSIAAYQTFYAFEKLDSGIPFKRDNVNTKNNGNESRLLGKRQFYYEYASIFRYALITGFVALGLLFLIFLTSLPIVRKRFYKFFYYTHHLFLVAVVVVLSLHVGRFSIWLATMILYAIDRSVRLFYYSKRPGPESVSIRRWSKNLCELRIPTEFLKLSSTNFAGKFINIQIPKISLLEWHSFNVGSNIRDGYIAVYIANKGKWTNSLFELAFDSLIPKFSDDTDHNYRVSNDVILKNYIDIYLEIGSNTQKQSDQSTDGHLKLNTSCLRKPKRTCSFSTPMRISYLYDSSVKNILENDTVLLVAGGTGISPMISIIKQVIRQSDTRNNNEKPVHKVSDIILIWACREPEAFDLLEETIQEISSCEMSRNIFVELYSTKTILLPIDPLRDVVSPIDSSIVSENSEFTTDEKQFNFEKYSNFVRVVNVRPNIKEIMKRVAKLYGSNKRIGVTAAGPDSLVESVYRGVNYMNRVGSRNYKIVLNSEMNYYSAKNG
ncbi:hypothetical protein BB558_003542 [Smittium angustum]|uniref:FAD-binding FR-type domain-containing protein n=1 Tax=Smittium angustum TaxID=133377 RepID=A0A2U1J5W1_SMIAN|nr:hypothetical protein BB558_003542 [Smittium angustum]